MTNLWSQLLFAVALVESGGDPRARNEGEGAVGLLQIRQCCVDDLNRVHGTGYKLRDFYDTRLSKWAFVEYGQMWGARTPEQYARIWNGGPRGCEKRGTRAYWEKVLTAIRGRTPILTLRRGRNKEKRDDYRTNPRHTEARPRP